MKNLFNSIKLSMPRSNVFDLSHDVKLSLNMGNLVPVMCMEAVPGDKFNISCESLLRFSPLVAPVMHRFDVTVHYFFCPNRLVWSNWESFITNDSPLPAFPYFAITGNLPTSDPLLDYLGIPTHGTVGQTENISAIPLAIYQKIWHEYYRDQNLISEVNLALIDGNNNANFNNYRTLRKRAWEHDYFTAALPWAQKGSSVDLPLGTVELDPATGIPGILRSAADHTTTAAGALSAVGTGRIESAGDVGDQSVYDPNGSLRVESTTINDLRRAFRLQEWLEKAARGGSRYIESILSHFGVRSSDKRLQRPEYITGVKSPVVVSEVLNTSDTASAPQGNMAGHAVSVVSGHYGSYRCEEHGYIMGIMSVMPKTAYQQGIPKHFLKITDPFQFYWPSFAHIGEQEVLNKEVYAFQAGGAGDNTFGYVPRYAEYKFEANRVAGDFRNTLDHWHAGRIFASAPALNQAFVEADPTTRIFAVTDPNEDKLYAHVYHKIRAVRPMPKFGTPQF